MEKKSEEPKIFLSEGDLFSWDKPLKPGYFRSPIVYNAQTDLVESLGMNNINESLPNYIVQATAAKYLARVIRLGKNKFRDHSDKIEGTPEDLILFNGNIAIYSAGQILGTELEGFDLESTGRIWLARTPTDLLRNDKGLYHIIFGDEKTEEGKMRRVKAISNGIEQMERDGHSEIQRIKHESWRRGRDQESERIFGTFGRGR